MYFYDIDYNKDSEYYFNVLVLIFGVTPNNWANNFPDNQKEIWYLDKITNGRPVAFCFYRCHGGEQYIDRYPHQIVEIAANGSVENYDMLEEIEMDDWRI